MAELAPVIAKILFWALVVAVLVAPRRWAILAFLVVIQIDVSGPGWASPSAVGLENAIKVLGLPLLLLLRLGIPALAPYRSMAFKLWLLFTGYVAVASSLESLSALGRQDGGLPDELRVSSWSSPKPGARI